MRLEDTQQCLNFLVRRAARIMARHFDDALRPAGLRATQFTLLAALAQTPAMPVTRLAEILAIERSALARNLKPLERMGYVTVKTGEDRRARMAVITARGRRKLIAALPVWSAAHQRLCEKIGTAESGQLGAALNLVIRQKATKTTRAVASKRGP